jgi:hypothetical protein
LVGDLTLFFLSCLTQSISVSYLHMMETPQSCLQKSTPTWTEPGSIIKAEESGNL